MPCEIDNCPICGAGGRCDDCFGEGYDPPGSQITCMSCGGSGEEPPMLPTCPAEGCTARAYPEVLIKEARI